LLKIILMKLKEKMFSLIENWQESGLSKREFLSGKGVKTSKFNYWLSKYRLSQSVLPSALPPALPACDDFKSFVLSERKIGGSRQNVSMEIATPSGVRITIYH